MLKLALIFLVVGLVLGALGFGGVGGAFVGIAKILFFIASARVGIFLGVALRAGRAVTGLRPRDDGRRAARSAALRR